MKSRSGWLAAVVVGLMPCLSPQLSGQGVEAPRPGTQRVPPQSFLERLQAYEETRPVATGWIARTARAMDTSESLTGTMPVAVVLALFEDSPEPHVSAQEVQAALFDGPSAYGTVSEFYAEASGGRFGVTGQTTPWIRTSLTMEEVVGSEYGLGEDARTGQYLLEAVAAADEYLDFSQFDNDGPDGIPDSGDDDGVVDAVAVQFLEVSASCGGPSIWPHRASIEYWTSGTPYETQDVGYDGTPILVSDYTTQGATDCGGIQVQNATTISHELGHVLGLPDLYDRSQGITPERRRWVVGCWSLMAAGAWGCGSDDREGWFRPTHFGAWEKVLLGWVSTVDPGEPALDLSFSLEPVQAGQEVLKIPLEPDVAPANSEYLLVEYRTQEGFDVDLPASGVLVYHVDPKLHGNWPCETCPQHYRVGLLEADGNDGLRRTFLEGGNRGEPGDAWGVDGPGTLTPGTYPSTRLTSGASSPVTIYRIAVEGGQARIELSTREVPQGSLLQGFLQTGVTPLTAEERSYLDAHGNGNGQYDVGDLRAYLRR
jgi:M6 family metalloprotease-like protein